MLIRFVVLVVGRFMLLFIEMERFEVGLSVRDKFNLGFGCVVFEVFGGYLGFLILSFFYRCVSF